MHSFPDHGFANKLTYFTGARLADVLTGKSDGIKLVFGTEEGRELVSGLYGDSLLNSIYRWNILLPILRHLLWQLDERSLKSTPL